MNSLLTPKSSSEPLYHRDDRGVRRGLYQGRTLDPLRPQRDQISDEELQKIGMRLETLRAFDPRIKDRRIFSARAFVWFGVSILVVYVWKRIFPAPSMGRDALLILGYVALSLPWFGVRLRLPRTALPEEIVRVFNEFRRCACCAYSIGDLRPEEDGCVVCPECGAAWKLRAIEPAMKPRARR